MQIYLISIDRFSSLDEYRESEKAYELMARTLGQDKARKAIATECDRFKGALLQAISVIVPRPCTKSKASLAIHSKFPTLSLSSLRGPRRISFYIKARFPSFPETRILATQYNMLSPTPQLPIEILDHIISNALEIAHAYVDRSILSSYALVGRLWRARTNAQRYRTIVIYIDGDTTAELQGLANICTSGIWPAHEGVARHVQHCTLMRGLRPRDESATFTRSGVRDAAVVAVLRSIFRHRKERRRGRGITAELSLRAGGHASGRSCGFNFHALGSDIISALDDLSRVADLERLELECVLDVPWSVVVSATLTRLQLKCVTFMQPDEASVGLVAPRECILPNLDDICLERSPSFMAVFSGQMYNTPSPVTKMCIVYDCARQEEIDYDVLYHLGGNVDSLQLEFTGGAICFSSPVPDCVI